MTGESKEIKKGFHAPFFSAGSEIKSGQCMVLAVAVGINTQYGRILKSLIKEPEPTPLQEKLEECVCSRALVPCCLPCAFLPAVLVGTRSARSVAATIGKLGGAVAVTLFIVLTCFWINDMVTARAHARHTSHAHSARTEPRDAALRV